MNRSQGFRWWRVALGVSITGCALLVSGRTLGWPLVTVVGTIAAAVGVALVLLTAVRWVWRRLMYRVGMRLLTSYLLVGVVPLAVLGLMSTLAAYMIVGQYASARLAGAMRFLGGELDHLADRAAEGPLSVAVRRLHAAEESPPPGVPRIEWLVAENGEAVSSAGIRALSPAWAKEGSWSGPVRLGGTVALASVRKEGARTVSVIMPLDVAAARVLSEGRFYEARFTTGNEMTASATAAGRGAEQGVSFRIGSQDGGEGDGSAAGPILHVAGGDSAQGDVEPGWFTTGVARGGFLSGRWVVWVRVGRPLRDWQSGRDLDAVRVISLLKTSIRGAVGDLVTDPAGIGEELLDVLLGLGGAFLAAYVLAAAMAGAMIVTVARSTARLTRGARAVARGDFAHRIPVRRRDQLGDLAASFNDMSESVERMLEQVAEKERLSRELELAREIQRSLLPPGWIVHGQVAVECHFSPAAEVGGDYFDVIAPGGGEVVVAVGDVAGHGIATGLLMAMVKSAVTVLVDEGYRGVDLLQRLNRLLTQSDGGRRMVTLVVAEVDLAAGQLRLASAGHPPALFLAGDSDVQEVVFESLPLGFHWPDPPPSRRIPFPVGARLVLYSDGVVEAAGAGGEAFGYDRLASGVLRRSGGSSNEVVTGLVDDVRAHLDGGVQNDDVTVLVIERLRGEETAAGGGGKG